MLNNRLLNMATDVASVIPSDKKLVCKPGSPLEYVFKAITPDKNAILSTEDINESLSNVVDKGNINVAYTNTKLLTVILGDINNAYLQDFKDQFRFVKNVVNPIVKEISSGVTNDLNERIKRTDDLTIIKEAIPEVLQGGFYSYVSNFVPKLNVQKGPGYKPNFDLNLTEDQIRALASKDDAFNESLLKLADEYKNLYGTDIFVDAWNLLLNSSNEELGNISNKYNSFLLSIVAFIIVDKIANEPIEGLGISTDKLTDWTIFARSSLARVIRVNVDLNSHAISNNILVKFINGKTITVYADVYDNWNEEDKNTILLGLCYLKDGSLGSISKIEENKDKLISKGRIAIENIINASTDDKASRIISSIVKHLLVIIDNAKNTEEYTDIKSFLNLTIPSYHYRNEILKYINNNYSNERIVNANVHLLIADIVCELFFKDTLANVIITKLAQTEIKHPEYNANELLSITVIDLVTEWVAGQILLIKK